MHKHIVKEEIHTRIETLKGIKISDTRYIVQHTNFKQ